MTTLSLTIIIFSLLIAYLIYYFYFNIYEIEVFVNPNRLKPDNKSTAKISIKPINSLGIKIPFRKVYSEIHFIDGNELVNILLKKDRKIILKAKNYNGIVKIEILSKFSLLPNVVELKID